MPLFAAVVATPVQQVYPESQTPMADIGGARGGTGVQSSLKGGLFGRLIRSLPASDAARPVCVPGKHRQAGSIIVGMDWRYEE
ncbi:hypothetical protein LX36DRAFT_449940 [Colletotrichum falcatum]|nr:hypothetical protein LX36DRAFT_449940 [Colletotrichum falcatum]